MYQKISAIILSVLAVIPVAYAQSQSGVANVLGLKIQPVAVLLNEKPDQKWSRGHIVTVFSKEPISFNLKKLELSDSEIEDSENICVSSRGMTFGPGTYEAINQANDYLKPEDIYATIGKSPLVKLTYDELVKDGFKFFDEISGKTVQLKQDDKIYYSTFEMPAHHTEGPYVPFGKEYLQPYLRTSLSSCYGFEQNGKKFGFEAYLNSDATPTFVGLKSSREDIESKYAMPIKNYVSKYLAVFCGVSSYDRRHLDNLPETHKSSAFVNGKATIKLGYWNVTVTEDAKTDEVALSASVTAEYPKAYNLRYWRWDEYNRPDSQVPITPFQMAGWKAAKASSSDFEKRQFQYGVSFRTGDILKTFVDDQRAETDLNGEHIACSLDYRKDQ